VSAGPGGAAAGTRTEEILGFPVWTGGLAACVGEVAARVAGGERGVVVACANPHSIEVARGRPEFAAALRGADYLLPDGAGVVLASRILGGAIRRRVTGSDFFQGLMERLDADGGASCFFLGSSPRTLGLIAGRAAREFPGVRLAGTWSPPYRPAFSAAETDEMVAAVNAARPTALWVGMTAPKQETWVAANRGRLDAGCVAAVGAVFDFYAGTVRRTHPWFNERGLEWLPRLLREPRRLWRRTFVSAPGFLARVAARRARRWGAAR